MNHTLLTHYFHHSLAPPTLAELALTYNYNINTLRAKATQLGLSSKSCKQPGRSEQIIRQKFAAGTLTAMLTKDLLARAWWQTNLPDLPLSPAIPKQEELIPSLQGDTTNLASTLLTSTTPLAEFAIYHGFNLATVQAYSSKYSRKALQLAKYLPPAKDIILHHIIADNPDYSKLLAKLVDRAHGSAILAHGSAILADVQRHLVEQKVQMQAQSAQLKQIAIAKRALTIQKRDNRLLANAEQEASILALEAARKEETLKEEHELTTHNKALTKIFAQIKDRPLHQRQIDRIAARLGATANVVAAYEKEEKETDTLDPNAVDYYYQREGNYSLAATARHFNVPRSVILTCVGQED